jgi:hypothetical protein
MDVPPGGTCGNAPCWRANGVKGFTYRNKAGTPNGLSDLKLKTGAAGKASFQVKGRGVNLPTPPLGPTLGLMLPVTAQLQIQNGPTTECWQTTYTQATLNSQERFRAKGP